jgi:hypothetical protein
MKTKLIRLVLSLFFLIVVSCDEPLTIVTNYVHPDGSVTRKIEMRNSKRNFAKADLQVPFDSTWMIKDTCEVSEKGDTTWIKRAEKLFKNVNEINLTYKNDSGANKDISRNAGFRKTFKWFNTEYRFSETIDKKLTYGYPIRDFLNDEELRYFYTPDNVRYTLSIGPDSLKFKALSDSVNSKTDKWTYKNLVSEWIGEFSKLIGAKPGNDITFESLRARENDLVRMVMLNEKNLDSLWTNGIILKEFIGEANALKYKTEADTAIESATKKLFMDFNNYSVRIVMPGKVIGTNGFIDSSQVLLWPVKSDYFLTENYEMWAESKVANKWAWIVSGLFLVFVLTGVILRIIKKG